MATHHRLTPSEKKACIALSWLFLDIEQSPKHIDSIASSLRALNIPSATLSRMLRHDVFPILYPNLLSVAGTWDVFDEDWLLGEVERRRATGNGWVKGLAEFAVWLTVGRMVTSVWGQVVERLEHKPSRYVRSQPPCMPFLIDLREAEYVTRMQWSAHQEMGLMGT